MNIALEGDTSTRASINSLEQSHIALSDSLGDTAKLDHQPLVDMARNYRSSSSRTTNKARQENQPNEEDQDTRSTLDSLRSQQQEDFSCLECLKSGCKHLYDFTIASCNYTFCNCLRTKRRSYLRIDEADIPNNDRSQETVNDEIVEIKQELKFHFMNPFEKWKYPGRRRFPWKLIIQLLLILLVTTQLWIVASQRYQLQTFVSLNEDTFEQLFIKNPVLPDPTKHYYDTSSVSTLITMNDLWDQLNYTASMYYSIKTTAVGPYGYSWQTPIDTSPIVPPLNVYVEHYLDGEFVPEFKNYKYSGEKMIDNITIHGDLKNESVMEQLNDTIIGKNFSSISNIWFDFYLSSVYLDAQSSPLCAQFEIKITIENRILSGSMPIKMSVVTDIEGCRDERSSYMPASYMYRNTTSTVLDCLVLITCFISTVQCIRSIVASARFSKKVRRFFRKNFNYKLRLSEYLPLYNLWFIGAVFSNILVAVGTILYLITSYQKIHHLEVDDVISIVYGIGVFFQWIGILRFLSYFDKYNMLLITLRLAVPSVLRFMVCGFIFYVAFLLLGWLVMGPYHPKFRDPSVTSECLYSLINGDDMFNTYIQMDKLSLPAFIFSKIYLYVFISLFIYVVLSVFISLISDTYETLHEVWTIRSGGLLRDFANDRIGYSGGTRDQDGQQTPIDDNGFEFLTGSTHSPNENSPLIVNGAPLLGRVDRRATPNSLNLTHSNPSSPRVAMRGINMSDFEGSNLYPRLGPGITAHLNETTL